MVKLIINYDNVIVIKPKDVVVSEVLNYAKSLEGVPFRWYDPDLDKFTGDDKFWCENLPAPSAEEIRENDKSVLCSGFPNLLRRFRGLSIPGTGKLMRGKYAEIYKQYPGGTGSWFAHLNQNKRLEKLDISKKYPKGTLLIARFKSNEKDQGHLAVVYEDIEESKTIIDQLIIHASPHEVDYGKRHEHRNHGSVIVEQFHISDKVWRWDKISYYKYVCLPENWLLFN
jgi:hypothetical protein